MDSAFAPYTWMQNNNAAAKQIFLIALLFDLGVGKDSASESHENLFSNGRVQPILCKDSANERHENLFSNGRVQPILCKDSANERHENLFSNGRVQPILCKDTKTRRNEKKRAR